MPAKVDYGSFTHTVDTNAWNNKQFMLFTGIQGSRPENDGREGCTVFLFESWLDWLFSSSWDLIKETYESEGSDGHVKDWLETLHYMLSPP